MSKANCSPELKALGGALRKHRRKVDLTQEELAADIPCISYGVYQKIEWGGREAGKKILPLMLKYFQGINDSEMVLALLEYAGANIAALQQQLEAAAWRWLPELPPKAAGRGVSDRVIVTYMHTMTFDKPYRATSQGAYNHRQSEWQGQFPDWVEIDGWKVLVVPDAPMLPEAESIQGGQG